MAQRVRFSDDIVDEMTGCFIYISNNIIKRVVNYHLYIYYNSEGGRGVMVIDVGNGHGDTSSNPERDW